MFTSLPLFGLFGMGIYSCVLLLMIDEELEERKKILKEADRERAEGNLVVQNSDRDPA